MSSSAVPKWKVVENVVAALERVLGKDHGWVVTPNAYVSQRGSKRRRQVDVYVACPSGERQFAVGIDVKHKAKPVDIETMEQLCAKGGKLALDRYVVISTSGFSAQAVEEARRHGVTASTLAELDVGEVIAIRWITVRRAEVRNIVLSFPSGTEHPPVELLKNSRVEATDGLVPIGNVAARYAQEWLRDNDETLPGAVHTLAVVDEDRHWRAVHAGDRLWGAPDAMRVTFEVKEENVPGHLFRTEDGKEILSAVVPSGEGMQQLTLMTLPEEGGSRIAVSVGPVEPPRTKV